MQKGIDKKWERWYNIEVTARNAEKQVSKIEKSRKFQKTSKKFEKPLDKSKRM